MCFGPPDPPDLGPQSEANKEIAAMNLEFAREQQKWAQDQDKMNRETLDKVLSVQLPIMQQQYENAKKDRARYEGTFQPIEDNLIKEFQNYDTAERRDLEGGRAVADVNTQFDAARRNSLQRLESFGVDPSQTRNAALDIGVRTQQAAAQAGAVGASNRNVENTGRALRAEAINIGKGLPSNVAASYGQSIAAGQAGVGGANQTTGTSTNALTSSQGFSGAAMQGNTNSANILNQGYQNQMAGYNAQGASMAGLGQLAGFAAMVADGGTPAQAHARQAIDPKGPVMHGPSDGSGIDDQVPAMISVGEYVIPADVVQKKGVEFFDKMLERYHTPAKEQRRALQGA